jgi:glycosyltransferase involved in cell wall biosynthesis
MTPQLPLVSIVVPCRNEAAFLQRSIGALLAQDYPADRLEILVVDGMSEDDSASIAGDLLAGAAQAEVITNPESNTPAAFNLGLKRATGEVVIIVSAHCELAADYVRVAVDTLDRTGADCVGGAMHTRGDSTVARGISLALSSPFGVGGVSFRTRPNFSGFVDTVPFGAYRRDVFDRIGAFDPAFLRNQDAELNFRITRSGGRIWMDEALKSTYYGRSSIGALWRQHFNTGASKISIFAKHRRMPALRHYIPGLFVAGVVVAAVAAAILRAPLLVGAVLGPYLLAVILASAWAARRRPALWPVVALAIATMHIAYGLGSLAGVWRARPRQRAVASRS